ncbi:neurotrimin [Engraulis encrasicolus]|uniref:neurotrimin n=1 Tax=Engraulis encrasicolus TaxID=184585 RepID=UPI002FD3D01E
MCAAGSTRSQEIEELERFIDSYVLEYQGEAVTDGDKTQVSQVSTLRRTQDKVAMAATEAVEVRVVLCSVVLCSVVLCSVVLCGVVLCGVRPVQCGAMRCETSAVWCYAVWCYAVWCYAVWCYAVWCYAVVVLCSVVLCSMVLCSVVLCSMVLCSVVLYSVVLCGVRPVQCGAMQCGAMQCGAMHVVLCSMVLCSVVLYSMVLCSVVLYSVVLCGVVLCSQYSGCSQGDLVTHSAWLNRSSIMYAGEDKWSVDPRVSLVTLSPEEFTIKIENVDFADEGQYICAVQTRSKATTTSVHVIVMVPPKISGLSDSLVVNEGANVSLVCSASGKPEPSVSWKIISPSAQVLTTEDEFLEIQSISRQRAGTYECTAVNDVATDTQTVELTVNYPPSLSEGVDVGVTLGQRGVLQCQADAVPAADFEWYRDDRRVFTGVEGLEIEDSGPLSTLTFFNVSEADYGNYTCVAVNTLGSANTSMILFEVVEPTSSTLLQGPGAVQDVNAAWRAESQTWSGLLALLLALHFLLLKF